MAARAVRSSCSWLWSSKMSSPKMSSSKPKASDWVKIPSKSKPGEVYYCNKHTNKCTWTPPPEFQESDKVLRIPHTVCALVCVYATCVYGRPRVCHSLSPSQQKMHQKSSRGRSRERVVVRCRRLELRSLDHQS